MSIQSEIDRLNEAKAAIIAAIVAKGIVVVEGEKLDAMAEKIAQIATGVELPKLNNPGTAGDLVEEKELINQAGNVVTGTIPKKTSDDITVDGAMMTVPAGYYENQSLHSVGMVSLASPSISVDNAGKITASVTQTEGYVSAGTKSATKQLTAQAAQTITPGTSDKTIAAGKYLTGTQTIKGDTNLVAANIKKGISIFGVAGSYAGSGSGSSGGSSVAGVAEFTLANDASTSQTAVKLGNVPWIADNINDANLFAALIRKDTAAVTNAISLAVGCNSKYFIGRYGAGVYKSTYMSGVTTATSDDVPFNNTTPNKTARVCADANGDVYVIPYSNYKFAAGDYSLIYGLL